MHSWADQIERCFELGVADPGLELRIDEILSWYGRLNSNKDALAIEFIEKYGESGLRIRFEEFVDRLLVEKDTGNRKIFPLGLSSEEAKTRYRKLIRLFHPDRGSKDEAWLNYRAEKVNIAYKAYSSYDEVLAETVMPDVYASTLKPKRTRKQKADFKFRYRANVWRERFGDPALLQKRIVYGLTFMSLLLVAFFYASTREPAITITKIVESDNLSPEVASSSLLAVVEPDSLSGLSEENRQVLEDAAWLNTDSSEDTLIDQEDVQDASLDIASATGFERVLSGLSDQQNVVDSLIDTQKQDNQAASIKEQLPVVVLKGNEGVAEQRVAASQLVKEEPVKPAEISAVSNSEAPSGIKDPNGSGSQSDATSFSLETLKQEQALKTNCVEPSGTIAVNRVIEGNVSARNLRLRTGPGADCSVRIALLLGKSVKLLKYSSDRQWLYISVLRQSQPEIFGWVSSQYITTDGGLDIQTQAQLDEGVGVQAQLDSVEDGQAQSQLDQSIARIFQAFKAAYVAGDAVGLSDLYLSTARENKLRGKKVILRSYQSFFRSNVQRSLEIDISSVQQQDEGAAIVDGVMTVRLLNQEGGRWESVTAIFNIMIIKTTGAYKIATFDWGV